MRRRLLSLLLAVVMVLGMLPMSASAEAVTLPVSAGSVDITDATVGQYTIKTLSLYVQGTFASLAIDSATQDGNTINVVLAESVDSSAAIQAGFAGSGDGILGHAGNKCTLSEGSGTMTYGVKNTNAGEELGTATYTINFSKVSSEPEPSESVEPSESEPSESEPAVYTVSWEDGDGYSISGETSVTEGSDYSFTVKDVEGYDYTNMQVYVNGEILKPDEEGGFTFTVLAVATDLTITVDGVVVKETGDEGDGGEEIVPEPFTIVTGDTATYNSYLGVITHCLVEGAKVLNCKVESSGTVWTLTLPKDTDQTAALKYTLTTHNYGKPANNSLIDVNFNGGTYTAVDSSDYTISFSGVPAWANGEAQVKFGTKYRSSTSSKRMRAYTLKLKLDDGVNDPPALTVGAEATVPMRVNETYSVDLSTVFQDPDSMDVTYQLSVNGAEAENTEASYSFTPTETGTYTLVFTASDGENTSAYTVTLNVRDNAAPVLAGDAAMTAEGMHGLAWSIDLSKLFTDADGDSLSYTVAVNEEAAAAATASYSYTPAAAGTYTLVFKAADPKGAESPAYTVTLTAAENPAPTLAVDAAATASVDQYKAWTYDLSTIFSDNEGDALTYTVSFNGAAAVAATASYSYTANTEGEQTFVFMATDKAGNTSDEHTVTLTVNPVPRTAISTYCAARSGFTFDGWLSTITVTGPEITAYEWVGGGSGHDEASDEAHTLNIQLADTVADDAVIALAYGLGGNTRYVKYAATPSASVTLVDGQATVQVKTTHSSIASWTATRNYTINFTNKTNTPPEATTESVTADVKVGEAYSINLPDYFTDVNNDALTYKVSVNGTEDVAADAAYTYTPTTLGEHVLVFKANDVWSDSTKNLTVTLNVANSETTYDVNVTAPEGYTLTFQAVSEVENGTPVTAGALTYADGVVKVPENISIITWSADSAVSGTAQVSAGAEVAIKTLTLSAKNAADAVDADSVIKVTDANGAVATVGSNGIALVAAGSGYTYNATPSSSYSGAWNAVTLTEQTVSEDAEVILPYTLKNAKSVTVPAEAEVLLYYTNKNFGGSRLTPAYNTQNDDGTVTYYYACTGAQSYNTGYVYRATLDGKITKAGYMKTINDIKLTWDANDKTPDFRDGEGYNYSDTTGKYQRRDGDGVLVTVNATGHLSLPSGIKNVGAYRIWNIIDSDTTNVGIEPDFNFEIVAGDNVVTFTDLNSAFGNNWQRFTPNGAGTAFVEVSYDAIHVVTGWPEGGTGSAYGQMHNIVYNASNPQTNGLIVVQTDGNAASDVTFNIASDRVKFTRAWDAEHDTYYITADSGELTLTPTATSGIKSVAVSNDKGATFTTLESVDGAYTATVVPGNNIIRVTNANNKTAYQVVRVLKADITLVNQTDSSKGEAFAPGDTVRVNIRGLINPVSKMGGIYNPNGSVQGTFAGSDGNEYSLTVPTASWTSGYIFNGSTVYFDVMIPEDGKLTLTGNNMVAGGNNVTLAGHRSLTMSGAGMGSMGTPTSPASVLPVIVLGEETASNLPVKTADDVTIASMRLGQWHEMDLTQCFTDDLDANLTYYLSRDAGTTWEEITVPKAFLYFPEGTGDRSARILALDSDHTLDEALADDSLQYLNINAKVEVPEPIVKVNISVSSGVEDWYLTDRDILMTPKELEVPYFDLSLYGLERYYYNPLCYSKYDSSLGNQDNKDSQTAGTAESASGIVTSMHALIYATEIYQLGYKPEQAGKGTSHTDGTLQKYLSWGNDGVGSSYMKFWPGGSNMNYFIDWKYPLGAPDWGSTADQQALYGGENICIHSIEDDNATGSSFAFFTDAEDNTNETSVAWGEEVELKLQYSYPGEGRETMFTSYADTSVSIISEYDLVHEHDDNGVAQIVWQQDASLYASRLEDVLETDAEGVVTVDTSYFLPGTYYLGAKGFVKGENETGPACIKLKITGDQPTVALDKKTAALKVGEEVTLTATVTPEGTAPSFKVDNGVLEVISTEGNQITVKALQAAESTALEVFAGNTSKIGENSNLSMNAENYDVCTIQIQEAEPEAPGETEVTPGDMNGDNAVTMEDVMKVIGAYRAKRNLTDAEKSSIDTNDNGIADFSEVMKAIGIYRKNLSTKG